MNYILAICDFILSAMNLYTYTQNGSFSSLFLGVALVAFGISFLGKKE